jgi:hypothetical protein
MTQMNQIQRFHLRKKTSPAASSILLKRGEYKLEKRHPVITTAYANGSIL